MLNSRSFKVNKHKTFQNIIVENKVYKIVLFFGMYMLLSRHKSKAFAHFEKEFFKIIDYRLFKV